MNGSATLRETIKASRRQTPQDLIRVKVESSEVVLGVVVVGTSILPREFLQVSTGVPKASASASPSKKASNAKGVGFSDKQAHSHHLKQLNLYQVSNLKPSPLT